MNAGTATIEVQKFLYLVLMENSNDVVDIRFVNIGDLNSCAQYYLDLEQLRVWVP